MEQQELKNIVEAALLAAGQPLSLDKLLALFPEEQEVEREALRGALAALQEEYAERTMELVEVGSGWRFQVRSELSPWVSRLWEERPSRYSRALLETLALVAYRQPITRAEIEDIRGVTVSSNIVKTLLEREWVRVVGHRDVPGKPAMYATTRQFLDYFNLKSLDQLPTLAELRDFDSIDRELQFGDAAPRVEAGEAPEAADSEAAAAEGETAGRDTAGEAEDAPETEGAAEETAAAGEVDPAASGAAGDAGEEAAASSAEDDSPNATAPEGEESAEDGEAQEDVADDATPRLTV